MRVGESKSLAGGSFCCTVVWQGAMHSARTGQPCHDTLHAHVQSVRCGVFTVATTTATACSTATMTRSMYTRYVRYQVRACAKFVRMKFDKNKNNACAVQMSPSSRGRGCVAAWLSACLYACVCYQVDVAVVVVVWSNPGQFVTFISLPSSSSSSSFALGPNPPAN